LVRWFPDKRGLATGMAIMGFGFSALIFGPLMQHLFESAGVANTFYILGVIYMTLILLSSRYLERPPDGYLPAGFKPGEVKIHKKDLANIDAKEALKTKRFYYIWIMMFVNISCGIAIISAASPMTQEKLHYTPMQAATVVGLIGVFNGIGRILWSGLSDHIGRANTYIMFFAFQLFAFYFLPRMSGEMLFLIVLFTVITMYGGGFATLPAFLGDLFGTKQLGAIHGMILTAWGIAGVAGPSIYDAVKKNTHSLTQTLEIFSGLFGVAFLVSLLMKMNIIQMKKQKLSIDETGI
jgi:MFS transporter, OFA family, oxalate/formate antiporter